ncbi:MAG: S-layer homology domain-containing protein [Ruminococcaceae bacterium]|nr:S-layer homology domain-containing protein [Oscillospiraceae bacterium]
MLRHWGAYSAGMLGAEGIIVGEEIGGHFYFYPDKQLTRIDFIILTNSIFGIKTKDSTADSPFADAGVPDYMLRQAIAAYEAGLISGSPQGGKLYLHPFEALTRAEAAKILDNGLKLQYPARNALDFSDAGDIPGWAAQAITNLESYGIIRGYEDNTFRPAAPVNKAQAGEMLYQTYKYRDKARKTKTVFHEIFYGKV